MNFMQCLFLEMIVFSIKGKTDSVIKGKKTLKVMSNNCLFHLKDQENEPLAWEEI